MGRPAGRRTSQSRGRRTLGNAGWLPQERASSGSDRSLPGERLSLSGRFRLRGCSRGTRGFLPIADRFGRLVRHPDRRQVARAKKVSQLAGVTAIGLHPRPAHLRHQRRGDDAAIDAGDSQPSIQSLPGRPRLIADPQRRLRVQRPQPLEQQRRIIRHPLEDFGGPITGFSHSHHDRILMDVQTNAAYFRHRTSLTMWSWGTNHPTVTHQYRDRRSLPFCLPKPACLTARGGFDDWDAGMFSS